MKNPLAFAGACVLISSMLGGCATPKAVHDLADKTAANLGSLRGQMSKVAEESKVLAERRAALIGKLHGANARQQASYELDVALVRRSQQSGDLEAIQWIKDWVAEAERIIAKAASAEQTRKAAVLAAQEKLDGTGRDLLNIAESLAALAKAESAGDRARFLGKFANDVRDSVGEILEKGGKSAENAAKLLDEIGIDLDAKSKTK